MYDIVIQHGTIVDGSGKPMFSADVALKEGIIVGVGDFSSSSAEQVIDATGCYVTPGFIDINNHSDTYWELLAQPELAGMLCQGVTTVIGGTPVLRLRLSRTPGLSGLFRSGPISGK